MPLTTRPRRARAARCAIPRRLLERYGGVQETGAGAWPYAAARTATPQEGVGGLRHVTEHAPRRIKNRRARKARSAVARPRGRRPLTGTGGASCPPAAGRGLGARDRAALGVWVGR